MNYQLIALLHTKSRTVAFIDVKGDGLGMGNKQLLRVGLLMDSYIVPLWVHKIIQEINQSPYLEISLVILDDSPQSQNTLFDKLKYLYKKKNNLLSGLYSRLDYTIFKRTVSVDYFALKDASADLVDVEVILAKPIKKKFTDRFPLDDVQKVKEANLDVMLRFGFRVIVGDILTSARYGCWSFHHDDNLEYRGGPACFWEIYERNPVTGTILQILSEKLDGGKVIYRSHSATNFLSLYLNRNPVFGKTSQFMLRRLLDLHRYGWDYIQSLNTYNEKDIYDRGIFKTPTNKEMLTFLSALISYWFSMYARKIFSKDQWFLAVCSKNMGFLKRKDLRHFKVILPPADRFYADPFLIEKNEKCYLFFEDYPDKTKKGVISCVEMDSEGNVSQATVVLEREYHLSYPFLFSYDNQIYMIPETNENNSIELYRAKEFPVTWELEKVLQKNVRATDATIYQHAGKLWLFVSIGVEGASTHDELFLYYSDSLLGEWHSHPKNPIVSDVRGARPAGNIFQWGDRIVRPAQDCSVRYGYAIKFYQIDILNEEDYLEKPLTVIEPNWTPHIYATHTFNSSDQYEVVDGLYRVFKKNPRKHWPYTKFMSPKNNKD